MSRPKRFTAAVLAGVLIISTSGYAKTNPTPGGIQHEIATLGPGETVDRLWGENGSDNGWEFVMDQIARGRPEWIALAPELAPGTDAGSAEELPIVLAEALPRNPAAVFAVINPVGSPVFDLQKICDMPFIEPTNREINGYFKETKKALSKISDPALQPVKNACLAEMEKAHHDIINTGAGK